MRKKQSLNRRELMAGAAGLATVATVSPSTAAQTESMAGNSLQGKTILITGCSSGFGRLGAEHYARLGATVFATMRRLPRV
ncbi:MAG: short-chain dehydrogenase/reductase, partial [Pseudomonadota bacterium]